MKLEQRSKNSDDAPAVRFPIDTLQGDGGDEPSPATKQSADGGHGKKTSLRRSWRSASPLTRIQIVVGAIVAVSTVIYYIASFYQTKSNFAVEHRGYLVIDPPTLHTSTNSLEVPLENPGRSTAENVIVHANEATMSLNSIDGSIQNRIVNGWGEIPLPPVAPASGKTIFNIPVPDLDINRLKVGGQFIYVAIRVSYVDEISGHKQSISPLCFFSVAAGALRDVQWSRCDPSVVIPEMEKWDENENPKYRWPSIP